MLVWTLVIAVTVIACGALFYAARAGAVNAASEDAHDAERVHQQNLLVEIDRAEADGRFSPEDAEAARAELARDALRLKQAKRKSRAERGFPTGIAGIAAMAVAVIGIGTYYVIGNPDMPGMPLEARTMGLSMPSEVADAVAKVEAQLERTPDDVRGWQVLGPVYMRAGRYDEAVGAYRRVIALIGESPDTATDLAEALSLANNGVPDDEAVRLLEQAAAADPEHVRSHFYLASEAMRRNEFARAAELWNTVIALSDGSEPWRAAAEQSLSLAEAGTATEGDSEAQSEMIAGMVEGLASRLDADGGTIDEWTQLVRAFIVLGEGERAQKAYDEAREAYPDGADRTALDALAQQNGLE
ncbi:MAG: c-type cytochrome biogenesis protein CcmI [Alphaproteobacteria bacterium]|nr:c-type cytochrome biogenesis protein CcmI [Alphaproteobacteria bacterium]